VQTARVDKEGLRSSVPSRLTGEVMFAAVRSLTAAVCSKGRLRPWTIQKGAGPKGQHIDVILAYKRAPVFFGIHVGRFVAN